MGLTLARAGPSGPIGPIGLTGPQGNGTVVVWHAHESGFPPASSSCTDWAGANITINVTGPGLVVVQGNALVYVSHVIETPDVGYLYIQNDTNPCTGVYSTFTVPSSIDSTVLLETLPANGVFHVAGPGEDTFIVMDMATTGGDVSFSYISLVAVFYPT